MNAEAQLMVIFGAGASYDSIRETYRTDTSLQPPVTRDLFGPRPGFLSIARDIPEARPLVAHMRGAAERGQAVEEELRILRDEADEYPYRKRQIVAMSFYLQYVLEACSGWADPHGGITNYVELVDRIERWRNRTASRALYLTFNYDTLLEDALTDVTGSQFRVIANYTSERERRVYRPHGCWRWGRNLEDPTPIGRLSAPYRVLRQRLIDLAGDWSFSDTYRVLSHRDDIVFGVPRAGQSACAPAISLPVDAKSDFSMPADHKADLANELSGVQTILAIGWRATEAHFLSLLSDNLPHPGPVVHIVTPHRSTGEEVAIRLRRAGVGRAWLVEDAGFSAFLDSSLITDLFG